MCVLPPPASRLPPGSGASARAEQRGWGRGQQVEARASQPQALPILFMATSGGRLQPVQRFTCFFEFSLLNLSQSNVPFTVSFDSSFS